MIEQTKKNSVLIVDDDKANIVALTHILSLEYTVYAVKNGKDAIEKAKEHLPDVILLDILMPEMDGYEVLSMLKNNERTREIPVIFVTGLNDHESEEKGLSLGAADYINKPFSPTVVKLRIRNQIQMLNEIDMIRQLSITDQLTGISNRRNFDCRLQLEWNHALRNKTTLSILLADIDDFKTYNDTYGHLQGDAALQSVAKNIEQSLSRSIDFAARWGGEEFAVLLPSTDLTGALSVAERIRNNIECVEIPCSNGSSTKLTVSIGVNTCAPKYINSIDDFVSKADKMLYCAKKAGKNKVCEFIP
ncbi:MAG: diguanylate cyclase [Fibromonadales bacterium]|nr:diguanylate cyclase [Fibromonadales bacterium]